MLSIDPKTAAGRIEATYGIDLARTASTSYLVQFARAAAGINASFFTFGKNPLYPGDPVGLGLYGGKLLSEPEATSTEVDFVINAKTKKALIGRLTWAGSMRHRDTEYPPGTGIPQPSTGRPVTLCQAERSDPVHRTG